MLERPLACLPMKDTTEASPSPSPPTPADRAQVPAPGGLTCAPPLGPPLLRVLEKLPLGLALLDPQDRVVFINHRARQITGFHRREVPQVQAWL